MEPQRLSQQGDRHRHSQQKYTNFVVFQRNYRRKVAHFFSDGNNYGRLSRIYTHEHPKIYALLVFFVVRYSKNRVFLSTRVHEHLSRHYCIRDQYENALKRYEKKFYDFEARAGKGELIYEGVVNPALNIRSPRDTAMDMDMDMDVDGGANTVTLALAKLNAISWLIEYGFDTVLWDNYAEVLREYTEFSVVTRKRYTDTHKRKNRALRQEAEKEILLAKGAASSSSSSSSAAPARTCRADAHQQQRIRVSPFDGASCSVDNGNNNNNGKSTPRKKLCARKRPPTKFTRKDREKIGEIMENKRKRLQQVKRANAVAKRRTNTKSKHSTNNTKTTILLDCKHETIQTNY